MTERENFYNNIKEWNNIDKKIQIIQQNLNELKLKKNNIKNNIISYVEDNNLNNTTIKVDNNQLRFINCKYAQPLTFKFLKQCLNDCIKDSEQADLLFEYIKDQRNINNYLDIKITK